MKASSHYRGSGLYNRGLSVIEIIIAAAIIVTLTATAAGAWRLYIQVASTSTRQSQAALFVEEGAEALRLLRDSSWTSYIAPLTLGTTYQLNWTGSTYQTTTSQVLLQTQFVRTFTLAAVNRDSGDNIVSSGGTNDPNTRKVTFSVFLVGATSTPIMQTQMYLHNVYAN